LQTVLYELHKRLVLQSQYLQGDESPIKVQDNHKKGSLHTIYHWVFHAPVEGLVHSFHKAPCLRTSFTLLALNCILVFFMDQFSINTLGQSQESPHVLKNNILKTIQ